VDNIPYTITMIPLIEHLGTTFDREPLIWALVLGADLGGNATIVGASANVVVSSMSEGRGHPITFRAFLRYGVPATLLTLLIATVFLWLRFLR
jgi:Na+/H+ antiporter NhaD/arsenite permease-like protein